MYPERLKGFVSLDSALLQRSYVTGVELCLLKRMEPVYRHYPWKWLLRSGTRGVATTEYGRNLMHDMMMTYDGDQKRYAKISYYSPIKMRYFNGSRRALRVGASHKNPTRRWRYKNKTIVLFLMDSSIRTWIPALGGGHGSGLAVSASMPGSADLRGKRPCRFLHPLQQGVAPADGDPDPLAEKCGA